MLLILFKLKIGCGVSPKMNQRIKLGFENMSLKYIFVLIHNDWKKWKHVSNFIQTQIGNGVSPNMNQRIKLALENTGL